MSNPTSEELSKAYSIWYYKYEKDPTFNPEDATDEQEADYEKILEEVMSKPQ
jgi:hypothetical protein